MQNPPLPKRRTVVGHRGACAYRPEHTEASYRLAVELGADAIDVDLVASSDGVLIVRHDDEISTTTDIAERQELADRRRTRRVDGVAVTGWFTEDLTAAEITTLRARERLPAMRPDSAAHDGEQAVMTFADVLSLRRELSQRSGRTIAVWPELKHPTHSGLLGLDLVTRLLDALVTAGLDEAGAPVVVQCFETAALRELHGELPHLPLLLLTDPTGAPPDLVAQGDVRTYADLLTDEGLADVSRYATWLGPHKVQVHPRDVDGRLLDGVAGDERSDLVESAHAAGLAVAPYTLRPENTFLPAELRWGSDLAAHGAVDIEAQRLWSADVDAVFADVPDVGVAARETTLRG